jgi:hypothetical protein
MGSDSLRSGGNGKMGVPAPKTPPGAKKRRKATAPAAAGTSTLTLDTAMGLRVGDLFTLGGDPSQSYRVTAVGPGPCVTFDVATPDRGLGWFWVGWLVASIIGSALLVWAALQ